jgi:hypothetical protein
MTAFSREIVSRLLEAIAPRPMPVASSEDARVTVHAAVSRVSSLYEKLRNAIDYKDEHLPGDDRLICDIDETVRRLQVYIACHRVLFRADNEMIAYRLMRFYFSAWMRPSEW